ncbi:MAG: hypothetical protein VYC34_06455 [Planctomycetota bacterium]|nr:hypothetical protein [Planctomycetota bacterium]
MKVARLMTLAALAALASPAFAQESALSAEELAEATKTAEALGARFDVVEPGFAGTDPAWIEQFAQDLALRGNNLRNIVITGYWPPTNEMLRPWSPNPAQNGGMYIGENWEGRGYNVIAFFPEFPSGLGRGEGDFEVDYQDTTDDWAVLIPPLAPVAIITTSRANTTRGWELETKRINRRVWSSDYVSPTQPTPTPPDGTVPENFERFSSLPMQAIVDAVDASGIFVDPFIADDYGGSFLSSYIGYFGIWECDTHMSPMDPAWCLAAGHIHVGSSAIVADATAAMEVTLRTLIETLNAQLCPADLDGDGVVGPADLGALLGGWGQPGPADLDGDGTVGSADRGAMLGSWGPC